MAKERKRKKKVDQSEQPQVKESAKTPVATVEIEEAHGPTDYADEDEGMPEEAGEGEGVEVSGEEKVQPAAPTYRGKHPPEAIPVTLRIGVQELRGVLELLGPAVARRTTLPVLENVMVGEGYALATDLEVTVKVALPEVKGPVLLPHKGVLEFLKYSPGHETAVIKVEGKELTIAIGGSQARFPAAFHGDYPPLPQPQTDHEGVLAGDALVKALTAVLPYAAKEQARPVLTGVALRLGDQVEVVAADGFRLAWRSIPGRLPGDGLIILPATAVSVLKRLWKRAAAAPDLSQASTPAQVAPAKRLIRLEWGADRLCMQFGQMTLMAQLVKGTFPDYHALIPTEKGGSVTAMVEDMQRGLKQLGG